MRVTLPVASGESVIYLTFKIVKEWHTLCDVESSMPPCDGGFNVTMRNLMEDTVMAKAIWNGQVLAESDKTIVVEGNHYFPPDAVKTEYFQPSETHTVCSWKGVASYYDVVVDGKVNRDAAWYYPDANNAAQHVKGYVAFWYGVKVEV
jgi:uncharacterized protein (DUF427 family)